MNIGFVMAIAAISMAVLVPPLGVAICATLLFLQLALMLVRPIISYLQASEARIPSAGNSPVFSVHIATHSEPAPMVIKTIEALLNQDWPEDCYEIIVMDNNTADPKQWSPVQVFCDRFGDRVKFFHQMGVTGAKAGALNIALKATRADATHIITVDADYVVKPQFLTVAASALVRTGADYVQFPQAYTCLQECVRGVDAELEEYFRSNATVADGAEAVLLTGTLCVISKDALVAAGGWSGQTTTEDAELGVRLCAAGFTGRFIDQVVGEGLLPLSLRDLEKQRFRWCSGNFQTLLWHYAIILSRHSPLSLHKRLVLVCQLSAWFNLAFIPFILLIAEIMLGRGQSLVSMLAASIVVLGLLDVAVRIVGRGVRDGLGWGVTLRALVCRIALAPQSAKATFDAVSGAELKFVVTEKSVVGAGRRLPVWHGLLFLTAAIAVTSLHDVGPLVLTAMVFAMLPLPAAIFTDKCLLAYQRSMSPSACEVSA